jgi:S-DNA-T family DNA segregation ATPase FtsK/SpoIIIE
MPKAKAPKPKDARQAGASPKSSNRSPITLRPETQRGIWAVVLFVVAVLTLLSLFEFAGVVGAFWRKGLGVFFGLGTLLMPLVFAAIGILVIRGHRFEHLKARSIGLAVTLLGLLGIFHIWTNPSDMLSAASSGQGGGWLGLLLAYPLRAGFGFTAGLIILIAVAIIGMLLLLDVGLANLLPRRSAKTKDQQGQQGEIQVRGIPETQGSDQSQESEKPKESLLKSVFRKKEVPSSSDEQANAPSTKEKAKEPEIKVRNVPESEDVGRGPALQVKDMNFTPPGLDLLDSRLGRPTAGDIKSNVKTIRRTLENFGIPVEMGDVSIGPTVTQYTFKPAEGIKLSAITALQNDLALALAAHPVRIEAPIPGKSLVGLEVPNVGVALVRLREILGSEQFQKAAEPLTLSLGRDVAGNPMVADLAKMPHLLIAGATGSGKSVAINTLLMSLLFRNSPQTLKIILVDPKRVELTAYNGIPHLITPVIIETKKTIHALRWCVAEMDKRYELLNASGKRNIASYNSHAKGQKLPYIAVVIDELADLMAVAARDVEAAIVRLAQMARAVGIHLVVATQRPSVDVITGLIKANITTRMAFNVASSIDSRTILDHAGAEKLLGNGDMLYITASLSKPKRIQGAYVNEQEVERVTTFLREHTEGEPEYVDAITTGQVTTGQGPSAEVMGEGGDESDPLLEQAKEVIIENQKASASLLQRRLSVGYARAARLLDLMEEKGWIGPGVGAKPREIFIGKAPVDTLPSPTPAAPTKAKAPAIGEDVPPPIDQDAPPTEDF